LSGRGEPDQAPSGQNAIIAQSSSSGTVTRWWSASYRSRLQSHSGAATARAQAWVVGACASSLLISSAAAISISP
jgi:hypothetical protein